MSVMTIHKYVKCSGISCWTILKSVMDDHWQWLSFNAKLACNKLVPAIKWYIFLTHYLTSQPALIKLDNENIGRHLTPLQSCLRQTGRKHDVSYRSVCAIFWKRVASTDCTVNLGGRAMDRHGKCRLINMVWFWLSEFETVRQMMIFKICEIV